VFDHTGKAIVAISESRGGYLGRQLKEFLGERKHGEGGLVTEGTKRKRHLLSRHVKTVGSYKECKNTIKYSEDENNLSSGWHQYEPKGALRRKICHVYE